jgi:hypothetical protein
MICHYFQIEELNPSQLMRLGSMLDGMVVGTGSAPPVASTQMSLLQRLELTPAQVEQLCAEHDSIDELLEALAKRLSGADPTHANPVAAHVHGQPPRRPSRGHSGGALLTFGGAGAPPIPLSARKHSSGLVHAHPSTTVTVTRSIAEDAPNASRLASSGRAFTDGGDGSVLLDDAVQ